MSPGDLHPHPRNPNQHPKSQIEALCASVRRFGWRDVVTVSKETGYIIKGHARRLAALALQIECPVVYQSFSSESEELAYVVADNRLAELSVLDDSILTSALSYLAEAGEELLAVGFPDFKIPDADFEFGDVSDDKKDETKDEHKEESVYDLKEAVIFPSSNSWGIPDLDVEAIPKKPLPTNTIRIVGGQDADAVGWAEYGYCGLYRLCSTPGRVVHFYMPDEKYGPLWTEAPKKGQELLRGAFAGVVAPDFSVFGDDPFAVTCYTQYQTMWVARYWQKLGLSIIPNLRVFAGGKYLSLFCAGIPKEAPCVASQCRSGIPDKRGWAKAINDAFDILGFKELYLYGGETNRQAIEPVLSHSFKTHYLKDALRLGYERTANHGK